MTTILCNNKQCLVIDGISTLTIPINTALVDLQQKRQTSGHSLAYYASQFYDFLTKRGINDFSKVTAADIRFFAEQLESNDKGPSVLIAYATLIDEIFDAFCVLNGHPHSTLVHGDAIYIAGGQAYKKRRHNTLAGNIIRWRICRRDLNAMPYMISYTKWYTPEEIQCIYHTLSLRDRCIFLCSIETGYRISSVLSIKANIEHIKQGLVEETFSKTGRLHKAEISARLQTDIAEYMSTDRLRATEKAEKECDYLFLQSKGKHIGQQLTYDAYYHALKAAEARIHEKYASMQNLVLHSHAGRSTYFNRLMHLNHANKHAGKEYLSDRAICHRMDWKSMDCLQAYYDFKECAIPPSSLYRDLYSI